MSNRLTISKCVKGSPFFIGRYTEGLALLSKGSRGWTSVPPPPLLGKCSSYLMKRGERNGGNDSNEYFFWLERKK